MIRKCAQATVNGTCSGLYDSARGTTFQSYFCALAHYEGCHTALVRTQDGPHKKVSPYAHTSCLVLHTITMLPRSTGVVMQYGSIQYRTTDKSNSSKKKVRLVFFVDDTKIGVGNHTQRREPYLWCIARD